MTDQKLSTNFMLSEFLRSETASRQGIDNTPTEQQLANLRWNATNLEVVRHALGHPLHITSGLRVLALNTAIGSKNTSDHIKGLATDFQCPGFGTPLEVCRTIAETNIPFRQLIMEHTWVHISWPQLGELPRREVLTLAGSGYVRGLPA